MDMSSFYWISHLIKINAIFCYSNTGKEYVASANKYDLEKLTYQDWREWFF